MTENNTSAGFTFLAICLLLLASLFSQVALAQGGERWFQIEVSIFSNENLSDRDAELWQADRQELNYPNSMQRLQQLTDLLLIEGLLAADSPLGEVPPTGSALATATQQNDTQPAPMNLARGPAIERSGGDFRFFDFQRDAFVQLPASESDFQQTNRAIERSPDHRLLFHGLWRQPLQNPNRAVAIYIEGGLQYGDQHELQGNITLRFNANRDRIVIDTDLWLAEFSATADPAGAWRLPEIPAAMKIENIVNLPGLESALASSGDQFINYGISRVFNLQQSRDMRSTEFHYLDHPALGVVILVDRYQVPAAASTQANFANDQ